MAPSDSQKEKAGRAPSWSTHDNACTHCRERKIRCGRERPRCANCKRDGVECGYSNPAKRVNHIKLLCNNVGGVEDRLSNIEAELSCMNSMLKTGGNRKLSIGTSTEDDGTGDSANDLPEDEGYSTTPTDHYIVRSPANATDRYHGPCTLFALCNDFRETLISPRPQQSPQSSKPGSPVSAIVSDDRPAINDAAKDVLNQICQEAGTEEPVDLQADPVLIRLPPKQLLMMAMTQFLQQVDYTTDLFVQSRLWTNMESVYSRPFTPADEAWAICFNTIILLVLGPQSSSHGSESFIDSQFVRPFLLTVRSALSNTRVLMGAKIVNVQALALLSIASQMYYPLAFAESIFAQTCVLARTMGLHQAPSSPDVFNTEEAQERLKVFSSLYLRDKGFSILRGSVCWLPSFDCSLAPEIGIGDAKSHARIELAKLQDESYRMFHSTDSSRRLSVKYRSLLLRIEQGLGNWASASELFASPYDSSRDVDLQLEFLAARICVFRKSPEPNHLSQAILDARASCLLVVIAYSKHEPAMITKLDEILLSKAPSKSLGRRTPGRPSGGGKDSSKSSQGQGGSTVSSRLNGPLDSFSLPAFFVLAANIISPSSIYHESNAEEDLRLLQQTCACYKEVSGKTKANNHTRKVAQAFENLLNAVQLIRIPLVQSPHSEAARSETAHVSPSTNNPIEDQTQFAERSNLTSPTISMPPIQWDHFNTKNVTTTLPGSPGVSTGLLTPMDSQFHNYDLLRHNNFFPNMLQHDMPPPGSSAHLTNEGDASMDYCTDSGLLFDFPTTNPPMTF